MPRDQLHPRPPPLHLRTVSSPAKSSFMPSAVAPLSHQPYGGQKDPKLANNWKTKAPADLSDTEPHLPCPIRNTRTRCSWRHSGSNWSSSKSDILNSAGETTEHLREDTTIVPDPPTVPPLRRSMRWSCAPVTVNANCSRRSSGPLPVSMPATTAIATRLASPLGWAACWRALRPRCRWKRSSA